MKEHLDYNLQSLYKRHLTRQSRYARRYEHHFPKSVDL